MQKQDALIAQLRLTEERMAECELLADGWFDNDVIGMDDYLVKPAQPKALFGILLKWLVRKPRPTGA